MNVNIGFDAYYLLFAWNSFRYYKDCPLLDKVAFCEDGYPDVIESKDKKFYIGVRFHPESLYKKDKNMNTIFKEFINACKK